MEIKRGDIVLCVVSGDYGKPRPGLVIQSDLFNPTHSSVLVLPITTHRVDAPLFRIDLKPTKANGLKAASQVMVDKATALKRDRIKRSLGSLAPSALGKCEDALRLMLGIS
jgi:mRNA interferase MazF